MNILILSVGTRNKVVQYFKQELGNLGEVIVTDASPYAPALYEGDKYYVVPKINDNNYLEVIFDICERENIKGIFSLIDPELLLLAKNYDKFIERGVQPIISSLETIQNAYDKNAFSKKLEGLGYSTIPTYTSIQSFEEKFAENQIHFPVFVKPNNGSASLNINVVNNIEQLQLLFEMNDDLIIQPFMSGQEYGVDVYIDILTKEIVSVFVKEKLLMRAGETDKARSLIDDNLFNLIQRFVKDMEYVGMIDIDLFYQDGDYVISEVNPRFGGGYPHAYECGVNIPKNVINNLLGETNISNINNYKENVVMMKYNEIKLLENEQIVK